MPDTRTVVETTLPLHVEEVRGPEGADETFLLVHGYGGSSYTWHPWVPGLAARGRVLLVDLKGFGRAPKPDDGRYTPLDLTDLLVELIRSLDLDRLTLVGHSLGGGLSLFSALRLQDAGEARLARLVLVASAAYPQRLPPFVALSRIPWPPTLLSKTIPFRSVVASVLRSIVYDASTVTDEQIDAYAAPFLEPEGIRAAMDVGARVVPQDIETISRGYGRIAVPALVVWGDSDRVVPLSVGEKLVAALPHARLDVLEGCGHLPVEEHPEVSLRSLLDFLDRTPLPAGRS